MLTTLVGDFRHAFEARGRELLATFDGVPHALTANPGRLREAVSVLVDNALQHGRGTCRIHVGTLPAGDLVRITVADEGDGVADEIAAHIFRRGFSAGRRPGAGRSGVGLSLARALIESDGGRLELTVRRPPVFAIVVPARLVTGRDQLGTDRGDSELADEIDENSGRSPRSGVRRDRVPHR
jgi:signal transduction histidine kinase